MIKKNILLSKMMLLISLEAFLEFCKSRFFHNNFELNQDKKEYHEMINKAFPIFFNELNLMQDKDADMIIFKSKFNGPLVNDITGLSGKDLGEFMSKYKNDEFRSWVLNEHTHESDMIKRIYDDLSQPS